MSTGPTSAPKQNASKDIKKACGEEVKSLLECKKKHPQTYKQECNLVTLNLAGCAAKKFCNSQWKMMMEECARDTKSDPCKVASLQLDLCFVEKGFPLNNR